MLSVADLLGTPAPGESGETSMKQVMTIAARVAAVDSAVLILGESGVGKERMARWLHDASPRGCRPFVAVNCGAIAESLLESELFGHARGGVHGRGPRPRGPI